MSNNLRNNRNTRRSRRNTRSSNNNNNSRIRVLRNCNVNPIQAPYKPPFGQKFSCQLNYTEYLGLSSTSSQMYQWRANSLYDPNYTGTGVQPAFFDNLKALYQAYCVTAARIDIECINMSTSSARVALLPVIDYSVSLSVGQAMQLPYASFGLVGPQLSGTPQLFLSTGVDISKFFGVSDCENDDAFRSGVGTNPSSVAYFNLIATTLDATALNLAFNVRIIFDCVMLNLYPVYDT